MNCDYGFKRGWWCSQERGHDGPCALRPRFWNRSKSARLYRDDHRPPVLRITGGVKARRDLDIEEWADG